MGHYYDIREDLTDNPDNWLYMVIGGRNTGKTYSALRLCIENNIKFVFVKRTNKDIKTLCAGHRIGKKTEAYSYDLDFSPFKSLNRDFNWSIYAFSIPDLEGVAAFWKVDEDGSPYGAPVGYIASLNAVKDIKGFDLSDCDMMIFDEFIPQPWERVSREEGEQIMELYKTVSRDREHRGRGPLKLVALANAVSIINPLMQVTEVTDTVAEMAVRDVEVFRDEDRHIFIRKLHTDEEFLEVEKKSYIYQAMGQTAWGDMAFGNQFAYNDFTNVEKKSLKNYKPLCCVIYKRKKWYIYQNQNLFYMCRSAHQGQEVYDLKLENDQKRFYMNFVLDLTDSCIENEFKFETYEMYDLIVNYKRKFRL